MGCCPSSSRSDIANNARLNNNGCISSATSSGTAINQINSKRLSIKLKKQEQNEQQQQLKQQEQEGHQPQQQQQQSNSTTTKLETRENDFNKIESLKTVPVLNGPTAQFQGINSKRSQQVVGLAKPSSQQFELKRGWSKGQKVKVRISATGTKYLADDNFVVANYDEFGKDIGGYVVDENGNVINVAAGGGKERKHLPLYSPQTLSSSMDAQPKLSAGLIMLKMASSCTGDYSQGKGLGQVQEPQYIIIKSKSTSTSKKRSGAKFILADILKPATNQLNATTTITTTGAALIADELKERQLKQQLKPAPEMSAMAMPTLTSSPFSDVDKDSDISVISNEYSKFSKLGDRKGGGGEDDDDERSVNSSVESTVIDNVKNLKINQTTNMKNTIINDDMTNNNKLNSQKKTANVMMRKEIGKFEKLKLSNDSKTRTTSKSKYKQTKQTVSKKTSIVKPISPSKTVSKNWSKFGNISEYPPPALVNSHIDRSLSLSIPQAKMIIDRNQQKNIVSDILTNSSSNESVKTPSKLEQQTLSYLFDSNVNDND